MEIQRDIYMNPVDMTLAETQEELEFAELSDKLANFTGDLVSLSQHEAFLHKLFSKPAGVWLDVFALCTMLKQAEDTGEQLREVLDGNLFVTWLNYPGFVESDAFCVISFFAPDSMWSYVAVYNKQRLLNQWNAPQNGAG